MYQLGPSSPSDGGVRALAGIGLMLSGVGMGSETLGFTAAIGGVSCWVCAAAVVLVVGSVILAPKLEGLLRSVWDESYSRGGRPALPRDPYNPDNVGNRVPDPQYPDAVRTGPDFLPVPTPTSNPKDFTKLPGDQGWRNNETGDIWKKDNLHKDHWDISDPRTDNKVKEIDFFGREIWPNGPKNKNK